MGAKRLETESLIIRLGSSFFAGSKGGLEPVACLSILDPAVQSVRDVLGSYVQCAPRLHQVPMCLGAYGASNRSPGV